MTVPLHGDLTSAENLHQIGVIASGDPGAIGAGKVWIDSDDGAVRVRNVADDGWLGPFVTAADITTAVAAILDGATFTGDVVVPDEAYGVGWDGSMEAPTKNAVYDKIESVVAGAPAAHAASHQNGGGDELSVAGLSGLLADGQTPLAHKTSHENGGADEISVAGLSGLLADEQTPLAHDAAKVTTGVFVDARLASSNDAGNSGTADTIDWSLARSQKSTLTDNVTYTFSNPVEGATYVLRVHTGAGGFTTTWPAAVHWASGTAPTTTVTASKMDVYTFHYADAIYIAVVSGQNYTP